MRAVYLLSFVSLFLSVLANPHPGGRNARGFTPSTTVEARDMTNAERLSRGLNLKAPVRRGGESAGWLSTTLPACRLNVIPFQNDATLVLRVHPTLTRTVTSRSTRPAEITSLAT